MADQNYDTTPNNRKPPESDAERLVHKHLADPNHVITDEELASIRVGVVAEPDTTTREALEEWEGRTADVKADSEEDATPGAQKTTPWDVIDD